MFFITFLVTLIIDISTNVAIVISEIGKSILPFLFSGIKDIVTFIFKKHK